METGAGLPSCIRLCLGNVVPGQWIASDHNGF
jgi:hypothetical protein